MHSAFQSCGSGVVFSGRRPGVLHPRAPSLEAGASAYSSPSKPFPHYRENAAQRQAGDCIGYRCPNGNVDSFSARAVHFWPHDEAHRLLHHRYRRRAYRACHGDKGTVRPPGIQGPRGPRRQPRACSGREFPALHLPVLLEQRAALPTADQRLLSGRRQPLHDQDHRPDPRHHRSCPGSSSTWSGRSRISSCPPISPSPTT